LAHYGFTEATLLSAMEGAGKLVDDEGLREAMSERGLGTPATRAQIIEELLLGGAAWARKCAAISSRSK
jgi:DNA topoisomerase-3